MSMFWRCFWIAVALVLNCSISYVVGAQTPPSSETIIGEAQARIDGGAYAEAISILNDLSNSPPLPVEALRRIDMIRAESLLGQGKYKEALVPARKAVEKAAEGTSGELADSLLLLARIEVISGASSQAEVLEQALEAAIRADGKDGLRALRAQDRIASLLSATKAAEAEAIMRNVLAQVARLAGDTRRDSSRFQNTLGMSLMRQSKFEAALAAFDTAKQRRLELLSERHPEYLESLHNYGVALSRLGRVSESEVPLHEALHKRLEVLGPTHPDTLITRTIIVRQLIDKSAFDAAYTEAASVVSALTATVGERDVRTIEALSDLGDAQFKTGKISEGLETYKRSYRLASETLSKDAPKAMNIGHEYAGLLFKVGRFGEALQMYQHILVETRKLFDDENRDTLATLHGIAAVMSDIGRTEEALEINQFALAALNKQVSPGHRDRLSVMNNLSTALLTVGRFEEALSSIDEVVRLRTNVLAPDAENTLLSRSNRGAILASLGRYPEAIAEHREVYAIRKRKRGELHQFTLTGLHNLASTLSNSGQFQEAQTLFEKIIAARTELLGAHNAATVSSMRGLASLLEKTSRPIEAKALLVKIVEAGEAMRTSSGMTDTMRRSYFATVTPAYKDLAILEAREGNFEGVLKASQLSKARTLIEALAGRGIARNIFTVSEQSELSDLEFQIAALDGQIPLVDDVGTRSDLEAKRSALASRFDELNASLQTKYPAYRDATEPRLYTSDEIEALLDEGTALLDMVHSEKGMVIAWSTGAHRHGVIALPKFPNLVTTVEAYRAALSNPNGVNGLRYPLPGTPRKLIWKLPDGSFRLHAVDSGPVEGASIVSDIEEIRSVLSSWLVSALPAEVISAKRWRIVPDGPLALVPLETLKIGTQWIAETHDLSYIQSASLLFVSKDRLTQYASLSRNPMLAIGNPAYSSVPSPSPAVAQRPIDHLRGLTGGVAGKPVWPSLPGSAQEVSALAALFELKAGTSLFSGKDASEANVLQLQSRSNLGRFRYIVFSTHGYLDRKYPDLSGIVLSQVDLGAEEDGYLRTAQLASFDFRSDLIFISACDSGVGKWVSGEGILGLPFALYAGGNATAVLTLWPVLDGSTATFVERFFIKVKSGVDPMSALAEVKREFLRGDVGDDKKSPAIWAPFMFYGW